MYTYDRLLVTGIPTVDCNSELFLLPSILEPEIIIRCCNQRSANLSERTNANDNQLQKKKKKWNKNKTETSKQSAFL